MNWLSHVADFVVILSAVFALLAWLNASRLRSEIEHEKRRQEKKIKIVLRHGEKALDLPLELRHKEFTRAEILGRLGMIPMKEKGKRFSLGYLGTKEFLEQLNSISEGDSESILVIPCEKEEFEQFDI